MLKLCMCVGGDGGRIEGGYVREVNNGNIIIKLNMYYLYLLLNR